MFIPSATAIPPDTWPITKRRRGFRPLLLGQLGNGAPCTSANTCSWRKNSEKYILRMLKDAENVIENDFKSETEVSGEKHLCPSAARFSCSFWHDREARVGPRSVGARSKHIIWHPFKPIFFKLLRPTRGLRNVFGRACPNCRQNFFRMWKPDVTRTKFLIIPGHPGQLHDWPAPYSGPERTAFWLTAAWSRWATHLIHLTSRQRMFLHLLKTTLKNKISGRPRHKEERNLGNKWSSSDTFNDCFEQLLERR